MSSAQRNTPVTRAPDDKPDAPESIVVGRYVVFPAIAMGGMASVHIGRMSGPVGFSRTVAVKRLHPQYAGDPEFVSMFLDEARLAARVQHPNVVSVLDVVALDGELFLIMDFVRGESLSRLLQSCRESRTQAPIECVVSIMAGILHGLHAAHEARDERGEALGIVHRDVSPQNVLVGADGVARLVDFGVARATDRVQFTKEGQIKGKLDYLAPEQLECAPVTRQTDIYAASIVLWEALAGRRLFQSEEVGGKVTRTLLGGFPPPSCTNARVSQELDRVVMKGMARRPEDRFQTAREMAVALERAAPAAPASRIGDWVMEIAADRLFERDRMITRIEALSDSAVRRRSSLLKEVARSRAAIAAEPTLPSVAPPRIETAAPEAPDIEVSCVVARTSLIDLDCVDGESEARDSSGSSRAMTAWQKVAIGLGAAAVLVAGISLGRVIARTRVQGSARPAISTTHLQASVPLPAAASIVAQHQEPEKSYPNNRTPTPSASLPSTPVVVAKGHPVPAKENVSQNNRSAFQPQRRLRSPGATTTSPSSRADREESMAGYPDRSTVARLAASGALAALMLVAASAVADSTAKAAADELFRDAVELASRGDFEGAASRFKASYEADPTLGTLLGLAMAEQRCGRLASAYVHYQELLDLSRRFHDNERESEARERMEALAPEVPRLVIRSSVPLPRGARVLLDSSPIPVDALGASIPVDPGDHTVVVRDGERQLFSQALRVAPGDRTSVSVSFASRTAGPVATPSRAAGSAAPSSPVMRNAGMITAGVGLALVAGGGYLWYRSDQTWREVSGQCPGAACSPDSLDRINDGKTQETWGRIGLIAGGIGLATGATLILWGRSSAEKGGSGKVAVGPGQVHVRLTF